MYRFGDMDEETQQQIRTPLRLLYAAGGLIALIEFGLCCLQNSMFTCTADPVRPLLSIFCRTL